VPLEVVLGLSVGLVLRRPLPGIAACRALLLVGWVISTVSQVILFERLFSPGDGYVNQWLRAMGLSEEEHGLLKPLCLLTDKPLMYIANVAENGFANNPLLKQVEDIAKAESTVAVPISAAIESELSGMSAEDKQEFLKEMGLDEPGLNRVIRAGYKLLGLQTYFTAGVKEVRAWTVRVGATAPQAAGVIHTDFERGFIRAEVTAYEDFIKFKGEAGAKEAGKLRLEGKEYVVQDGDVMHFRFNV